MPGTRRRRSPTSRDPKLLRPHNFPPGTPGKGSVILATTRGKRVGIIHVMGRVFMDPLDDPFACVAGELSKMRLGGTVDFLLVDIHGEATSEKMAMGHFCDGRASVVVGTHSHVPTADAQILPGGHRLPDRCRHVRRLQSVIGMDKAEPLTRFTRKIPGGKFEPANGRRRSAASSWKPTTAPALRCASIRSASADG